MSGALSIGESGTGSDVIFYGEDANAVGLRWDADYAEHGALLLGADDHGVDLIVWGETPTRFLFWDQSLDTLKLAGHFAFNDGALDLDFRAESQNIPGMIVIDSGTDQLILHSSGTTAATAGGTGFQAGSDVATYISGTVGSAGVAHSKGATLVTGDLVLSGALSLEVNEKIYFNGPSGDQSIHSSNGNSLFLDADDFLYIYTDMSMFVYGGTILNTSAGANFDFRVKGSTGKDGAILFDAGTSQLGLLTDGSWAANAYGLNASTNPIPNDVGLFISGAIGSVGTTSATESERYGAVLIGGDLVVSGTIYEQTLATLSFYVGTNSNALASKLAIFDEDNYASFTETNMISTKSIGFDESTGAFSLYQARPHMVTMNLTITATAIITVKISVEADSVEIFTVSPMVHSSVDPVERTVSFLVAGPTVAEMNAGTSKELIFYVTPPSNNVTIVAGTSITIYAV